MKSPKHGDDHAEHAGRGSHAKQSESGNRPGVDERPEGTTELEAGRAIDGKAGLQDAGRSSVGKSNIAGTDGAADMSGEWDVPETAPDSNTDRITVLDRDFSGNLRRSWHITGHPELGEVVPDQEKGPNGEQRYFVHKDRANVGGPVPFHVAISQLGQPEGWGSPRLPNPDEKAMAERDLAEKGGKR